MAVQQVAVNGVNLAYEARGTGPAVVLVHGFPLDHEMWAPQIEELSRGYRVIAPDMRGFGGSQLAAADVDAGAGMEAYARDLVALLDSLGVSEPVALAGLSMGGYIGWQFALRHPERLRGLALLDTRAVADADEARAGRLKMAEAVLAADSPEPALAMIPKLLGPVAQSSRPDLVELLRSMILRQSPKAIAAAQRGMARREDVRPRLKEIACPCVGIVGVDDVISTPKEMQEIVAGLPRATYVEIPNAGHMTTIENPDATTAALRSFVLSLQKTG